MADELQLLDGGRCAEIYEFGPGTVLKLYDDRFTAEWVGQATERAAMVADAGVSVPRVVGVESIDGRHGAVMERIDGRTLWEEVAHRPADAASLGEELARLHAELHTIEVGEEFVDALELMRERIAVVSAVGDASRGLALAQIDGAPSDATLLHGDLHPGNVMVRPSGEFVAIDWDFPRRGPATHDACRAFHLVDSWALAPGTDPAVVEVRRSMAEAYLAGYCEATGVASDEIAAWTLAHAVARFAEGIDEERSLLAAQIRIDRL